MLPELQKIYLEDRLFDIKHMLSEGDYDDEIEGKRLLAEMRSIETKIKKIDEFMAKEVK